MDLALACQALASEVQEPALKMHLTLALDAVVERVSPQLPAGFEFLRDATSDLPYGIVPDVAGMDGTTGRRTLSEAGYVVGQDPAVGPQYAQPGTVTIFEGDLAPKLPGLTKFPGLG